MVAVIWTPLMPMLKRPGYLLITVMMAKPQELRSETMSPMTWSRLRHGLGDAWVVIPVSVAGTSPVGDAVLAMGPTSTRPTGPRRKSTLRVPGFSSPFLVITQVIPVSIHLPVTSHVLRPDAGVAGNTQGTLMMLEMVVRGEDRHDHTARLAAKVQLRLSISLHVVVLPWTATHHRCCPSCSPMTSVHGTTCHHWMRQHPKLDLVV